MNRWISTEYYSDIIFQEKIQNVMKLIEKQYVQKDEQFILVHPTEKTLSIMKLGKSNSIIQSLCNTLSSGIDIKYMYASALHTDMFTSGITDKNTLQLYKYLIDLFSSSGMLLELQRFFRDAIETGEIFGWFPFLIQDNIPQISKNYIIAYMLPQKKWIAKDIDGNDICLHFFNLPDSQFLPCSTVKIMQPYCEEIENLRRYFSQSIYFSSRPSYILSTQKDIQENKKESGVLKDKMLNVAGVNRHLENMIKENIISTNNESLQKRTSLSCKLHNYVSSVGSSNIDNYKERKKLERQVQNLQDEIQELKENNFASRPLQCYVPEGMDVAGTQLSVNHLDMLSFENKHQTDWMNVSVGIMNSSDRHLRKETNSYSQITNNKLVKRKQFLYQQIIVHDLLGKWLHKNNITLNASSDIDWDNMSLSDITQLRNVMTQEHFDLFISKYIGLPIEMISHTENIPCKTE